MSQRSLHESYQATEQVSPPSPRATGLVFTVMLLVLAILGRNMPVISLTAMVAALAIGLVSWRAPERLALLNHYWFKFSLLLHHVVSPLILGLVYLVVIVPFGLIMQLFRDPLRRSKPQGDSYWQIPDQEAAGKTSMKQQF